MHEFQNLRLNRNVEGRGRLVGNQNIGFAGQSHGDHNSLTHAAGELKGVLLHAFLRLIDVDETQHFDRTGFGLGAVAVGVQHDCFRKLMANRVGGIQRGHGVLKNDRNLIAANIFHDFFAGADQLGTVPLHRTFDDFACGCEDLHNRISRNRLAGTGFADNSQHFAVV